MLGYPRPGQATPRLLILNVISLRAINLFFQFSLKFIFYLNSMLKGICLHFKKIWIGW